MERLIFFRMTIFMNKSCHSHFERIFIFFTIMIGRDISQEIFHSGDAISGSFTKPANICILATTSLGYLFFRFTARLTKTHLTSRRETEDACEK